MSGTPRGRRSRTLYRRHGTKRVAKAVLIGAVTPLMLKTAANPDGVPIDAFDHIRASVLATARNFSRISAHRSTAQQTRCQGLARAAGLVLAAGDAGRFQRVLDCIKAFSETDFTEDLKKFDIPTLIMHGADDQIVPIAPRPCSHQRSSKDHVESLSGPAHGMCSP